MSGVQPLQFAKTEAWVIAIIALLRAPYCAYNDSIYLKTYSN